MIFVILQSDLYNITLRDNSLHFMMCCKFLCYFDSDFLTNLINLLINKIYFVMNIVFILLYRAAYNRDSTLKDSGPNM